MKLIDTLNDRGFVEQTTHTEELNEYLEGDQVSCYIGFDPTASSLHVGSLVPIMSLAHMQRHGHRPIALIGGGTGLVGDPSGKTETRKLLTAETVGENARGIKKQLSRFMDFNNDRALLVNNADWLTKLEYIPFLRDIGRYFSVNRMIKSESYKLRLESDEGLTFIEFNYMLLQAYDFMQLCDKYQCRLQMGGSDQWGNIVAGIDLIRRLRQTTAFGITFPLTTTSSGVKMGKTVEGAVWLDPERTTPYEYYQYWINTDDRDVCRFLALYTFLPMNEIRKVEKIEGADLNTSKTILAFEATRIAHGPEEAIKAYKAAASVFGYRVIPGNILKSSTIHSELMELKSISGTDASVTVKGSMNANGDVPHSYMDEDELKAGIPSFKLFHKVGLVNSGGASRRLIEQGGAYLNGRRIESIDYLVTDKNLENNEILLRAGKKRFHKIKIQSSS